MKQKLYHFGHTSRYHVLKTEDKFFELWDVELNELLYRTKRNLFMSLTITKLLKEDYLAEKQSESFKQ